MKKSASKNPKSSKYKWWHDQKIVALIVLLTSSFLLIFSFLEIPFLSSINKYTIEMVFGWYYPLVYLYFIFMSLKYLFSFNLQQIAWIKINNYTYWFFVLTVIFTSVATGFYQSKTGSWTEFGTSSFQVFSVWWSDFVASENGWLPAWTNGGIIGALMYALSTMVFTGVGAFVLAVFCVATCLYAFFKKSLVGFLRKRNNTRKLQTQKTKGGKKEGIFETKPFQVRTKKEELPFEDPF